MRDFLWALFEPVIQATLDLIGFWLICCGYGGALAVVALGSHGVMGLVATLIFTVICIGLGLFGSVLSGASKFSRDLRERFRNQRGGRSLLESE